ncbi:LAFE_0C03972g1_1 [Lachancea fermentati]|uniref:Lon protease homolog 2, peroxisomal n=1 Tax=Lachancea fermentati TaxID=4955 RepID=A0A1G4M9Q1_LACFM|nr:LAFE_0C03972g1_1 [Lachancea fermentati]
MGLFSKKKVRSQHDLNFPCLNLRVTPAVVPLPGVLYRITIPRSEAASILSEFKKHPKLQAQQILKHIRTFENGQNVINDTVYESLKYFQENYSPQDNSPLYVCLVSSSGVSCSYGCISKICGVTIQSKTIVISFKGLMRAEVQNTLLNYTNKLWASPITISDELGLIEKEHEQLQKAVHQAYNEFHTVDKVIEDFKSQYRKANNNNDAYGHLLLLSPLANTLYFQLNRSQFSKSWSLLKNLFLDAAQTKSGPEQVQEFLTLMDITMSLLPTTFSQRAEFLSISSAKERFDIFLKLLKSFESTILETLNATKFVLYHFQNSSDFDRSLLIAKQLESLKFFLGSIQRTQSNKDIKKQLSTGRQTSGILDEKTSDENDMIRDFLDDLKHKGVDPDAIKMLLKDFKKLSKITPQNSEYQVLRNYFDIIMDIPFGKKIIKKSPIDLKGSEIFLNKDHYGLVNVKKRLLEYLSVLKLNERLKSKSPTSSKAPILLLVGPPGVGKTSIAKSVAEVLGRKFQRISLGGIHNEADIRGHRRTYVGSMCGLIVNALRKSSCMNPLILLDEIDKVLNGQAGGHGARINGDPGAALLEVLDPEQNNSFVDHYVGFPLDLSDVLFFCTANRLDEISEPLLDRMEIIEIPGYNPEEKIEIGSKYLLPKQIKANGLTKVNVNIKLTEEAWKNLVFQYIREPGVRNLERKLATIARGKVVEFVENEKENQEEIIESDQLIKYLGLPMHPLSKDLMQKIKFAERYGVVNGLAYNSDGTGSVLIFEVVSKGRTRDELGPRVSTTGNLGSILNESIQIATTLVKSIIQRGLIRDLSSKIASKFLSSDLHLHVPMGSVSKDGPSAGVAIALCLLSMALTKPVPADLCLTGEITLRGKVLPIGGVKEKLLGAQMYGMKTVLIPGSNRSDVIEAVMDPQEFQSSLENEDLPELNVVNSKMNLNVHYVEDFYDVITHCWSAKVTAHDVLLGPARASL